MRYVFVAFLVVLFLLFVFAFVIASQSLFSDGAILAIARQFDQRASDDPTPIQFTIREGETASTIAERLERDGLISSALTFRLLARIRGADAHLEAGQYELRRNMTASEIIDKLEEGRRLLTRITTIEGWRSEEMADLLDRRGLARREEFLSLTRNAIFDYDFLADRPKGASLEGYLFPDTYDIRPGSTATDIVRMMLSNFGSRFDSSMREKAARSGLTIHQVVTLASIVEREAAVASERPTIAGVFLNRLEAGVPLQADPTVQYAVVGTAPGTLPDYWKKGLSLADLQVESPYNTYRVKGLPPGPIANPGLASLVAVIEPAETDYLYFVAKPDGSHEFARTLEEHNRNVAKYGERR